MTKAVELAATEMDSQVTDERILNPPASADPTALAKDATRLGGYAYQIIRQQSKQVFKLRSQVLADTDVENLHQMRIGTRRLRSALLLFADVVEADSENGANDTESIADLAQPVKQLTKALGKVRDIDVMQQWFSAAIAKSAVKPDKKSGQKSVKKRKEKKLGSAIAISDASASSENNFSKKEKKVIESLLKKLKKRRKKQFAKMTDVLKSSDYKKLRKRCKRWLKQPSFSAAAEQPATSSAVSKIISPLKELLQHPGWQVATCQQGATLVPDQNITLQQLNQQLVADGEQLHDLRKQIKQTRYQTEFFRSLYGITYAAQIREFRTLQKVLGQLQDQLVIADFLTGEFGEAWVDKLPTLAESFQASRLALWHQWQPLQAKYLQLGERGRENVAA